MNKNNKTQYIAITIILISILISGYILISPKNQAGSQVYSQNTNQNSSGLAQVVNGKQVIKMTVLGASYSPNYFKVKAGIPVQWEITSSGQSGCDSGAIIANGLLQGITYLNPGAGQVNVVEFTPQSAGTYKFSCTMGMVRGTIEVIN